jgi:SAM-dependent methyltransferase
MVIREAGDKPGEESRATEPDARTRWNARYASGAHGRLAEPLAFLAEHLDLLPRGPALDLAMGTGRNAVYLAANGFQVVGIDVSEEAVERARALAGSRGVQIDARRADLEHYGLPPDSFDVILCAYYLQRDLFPQIRRALRRGGVAVVETYTVGHLRYRPGFPRRYCLEPGELLDAFRGMHILRYRDVDDGSAAYASILARHA